MKKQIKIIVLLTMVVVGQELSSGYFSTLSNRAKHYWQRLRRFVVPKPKIILTLNAPIKVSDEIRARVNEPLFFGRGKRILVRETTSEYNISDDLSFAGTKLINITPPKGFKLYKYQDNLGANGRTEEEVTFVKDYKHYSDWIDVKRYSDGKLEARVQTKQLLSPDAAKKLGYVEE